MTVYVVDRSNNNPPSDTELDEMRAAGIRGLILKASEGSRFADPDFVDRARAAAARGFDLGAYAFVHANVSPQDQAGLFNRVVESAGVPVPIRCADAETADGDVQDTVDAFCPPARINLLYSGAAFARSELARPVAGVDWWIAAYGQADPGVAWGTEAGWQFTDGSAWGDCSVFDDNVWAQLTGRSASTPQEDDDMPPLWFKLDVGNGHHYLINRDSGECRASAGAPFVNYVVLGVDDAGQPDEYAFGPARNGGVFAYPGLPAADRQGTRRFVDAWLG